MCISFIALLIFTTYFLAHIHMLTGFQKATKETYATVVQYISRGHDDFGNPHSYNAVIEYYNEYQKETVRKETLNFGIPLLNIGDTVKIQYTATKERCTDERFIKPGRYRISKYVVPIAASVCVGFGGFVLLVISIVT